MDFPKPILNTEPSETLEKRIVFAVRAEHARCIRLRWRIHSAVFSVLTVAFLFAGYHLWTALHATGFFMYASLLATDGETILRHIPSYLATLSESFPDVEFIACVLFFAGALTTVRHYYRGLVPWSSFHQPMDISPV